MRYLERPRVPIVRSKVRFDRKEFALGGKRNRRNSLQHQTMVIHALLHFTAVAASTTVASCFAPRGLLGTATSPTFSPSNRYGGPEVKSASGAMIYQDRRRASTTCERWECNEPLGAERGYRRARGVISASIESSVGIRGGGGEGLSLSEESAAAARQHDPQVQTRTIAIWSRAVQEMSVPSRL